MKGQAAAAVVAVSLKGPTGVMEQAVAKKRMILVVIIIITLHRYTG